MGICWERKTPGLGRLRRSTSNWVAPDCLRLALSWQFIGLFGSDGVSRLLERKYYQSLDSFFHLFVRLWIRILDIQRMESRR